MTEKNDQISNNQDLADTVAVTSETNPTIVTSGPAAESGQTASETKYQSPEKSKFAVFMNQKWVRITAPIVAGVLLLGIGSSIGYAVGDEFDRDDRRTEMRHNDFAPGVSEHGERSGCERGSHGAHGDRDRVPSGVSNTERPGNSEENDNSSDQGEQRDRVNPDNTPSDPTQGSTPDASTANPSGTD